VSPVDVAVLSPLASSSFAASASCPSSSSSFSSAGGGGGVGGLTGSGVSTRYKWLYIDSNYEICITLSDQSVYEGLLDVILFAISLLMCFMKPNFVAICYVQTFKRISTAQMCAE
jgi:hypothetical protein